MTDLIFDVETTGLPKRRGAPWHDLDNWPRIVQIAWVVMRDGHELACTSTIIRPVGFTIPTKAAQVHGITTDRARREGRPWPDMARQLLQDVARHRVRRLVAHNVDFDRPVLLAELHRAGLPVTLKDVETFCTMKAYADARGGKWPRLDEMHRAFFGTGVANAHDALADVRACASCLPRVEALVAAPLEEAGGGAIGELIADILAWADENPWFDTAFVEKMNDILESGETLTPRQAGALRNIASRFLM